MPYFSRWGYALDGGAQVVNLATRLILPVITLSDGASSPLQILTPVIS
jgi:hypothetical protein